MTTKRTLHMTYGTACFRNMTYARHYFARQHHSLAASLAHGGCSIGEPKLLPDETYEWNAEGRAVISVWNMPARSPVIIAPWQLPEAAELAAHKGNGTNPRSDAMHAELDAQNAALHTEWRRIVDQKNADRG